MGLEIQRDTFDESDYRQFAARLEQSLVALREVVARPGFGEGPATIGAELELYLVDAQGRPLPENRSVLAAAAHPRLTLETDRFNLECNLLPAPLRGRPFAAIEAELGGVLAHVAAVAAERGGRVAMIGILPTLREEDVQRSALTESARYRALSFGLRRLRAAHPFEVAIAGDDELRIACDDVTVEGANTSWQVHLKIPPCDFARTYNAAQIAIAPALALGANAPIFLGRRLWDETRIALFRQAVDERVAAGGPEDWRPARVTFGHGWVRCSAYELFCESVALHPPIIPALSDEEPLAAASRGVPSLAELRLHVGTTWRWNRPVYDPAEGGHVRIEMRALPAGPTIADAVANAAFLLGLTLALAPDADRLVTRLTFGQARWNFYAAARLGLDAELLWPRDEVPSPQPESVVSLLERLVPLARQGLLDAGVEAAEADRQLGVIQRRLAARTSGARWQRRALAALERGSSREAALHAMLERYLEHAATGAPVAEWPVP